MMNDLIWMIKQYDWFGPVLEDSKYCSEERKQIQKIIERVQDECNIDVLEEANKHVPNSTGALVKRAIIDRIQTLRIVYVQGMQKDYRR